MRKKSSNGLSKSTCFSVASIPTNDPLLVMSLHCSTKFLLYKATRNGFGAKDFHLKCDNFENTLVVIKSTEGNIFGGFASKPWNNKVDSTDYGYVYDALAYIFSLVNKDNKPFKTVFNNCRQGIFCCDTSGPSFGYIEREINGANQRVKISQ